MKSGLNLFICGRSGSGASNSQDNTQQESEHKLHFSFSFSFSVQLVIYFKIKRGCVLWNESLCSAFCLSLFIRPTFVAVLFSGKKWKARKMHVEYIRSHLCGSTESFY